MSKVLTKKAIEVLRAIGSGAGVVRVEWISSHSTGGSTRGHRFCFEPGGISIRRENIWRLETAGLAVEIPGSPSLIVVTEAGCAWLEANVRSA
jgi:hypothetical protein